MNDSEQLEANELARFEAETMAGLKPDAEDPILDLPPMEVQTDDPPATPAAAPAPTSATAPAPAPAAGAPTDRGDPRAALRASRRAERESRENATRLAEENAELRKQLGQPAAKSTDEIDMEAIEADLPSAAPVIKQLVNQVKELQQQSAAPKKAEVPAFVPDMLPPEIQAAVEQVPQLDDWQHDPDQTAWTLAKKVDSLLLEHPAWKDKPMPQRMAEVARRVSGELGTPKPPTPNGNPNALQQRLQDAPSREPETLSDLRGGVAPSANTGPDFYSMKSDEDVMTALARLG
jgi:hypothetical protein